MKKIITLLFFVGAFTTSFAQYDRHQNNDARDGQYINSSFGNRNYDRNDKGWGHFNRENIFSARERDFQVAKINRDFDRRVEAIQCDRYLRRHEKREAIRNAEIERSRQIQLVNASFNCNR